MEKGRDDYITHCTRYARFIFMNLFILPIYVCMECWVEGGSGGVPVCGGPWLTSLSPPYTLRQGHSWVLLV